MDLTKRPRRLRRTAGLRALVRETHLAPDQLVYPLFVCEGSGVRRPVSSMPGVFQLFENQHARAVADDESVTVLVERTAGMGGVVVPRGQGA